MTSGSSHFGLKTPIVFLIFNRPDTTIKVFECIRQARPKRLFVVADGPRSGKLGEADACRAARAVVDMVDWECEVRLNYSETNLGCMKRVSTGLDWTFELAEEAIVLEDDCIPDPTFFRFCEELLERYRDDTRIMTISGDNFQFGRARGTFSYYFSRYNHCWGWATWRRAWKLFDVEMREWPVMRDDGYLLDVLGNANAAKFWTRIFDAVSRNQIDSWAYRWTFAAFRESGFTILPMANLVSNIGFNEAGTHTLKKDRLADLPTLPVEFPLRHPPFVILDKGADDYTQKTVFSIPSIPRRIISKLRRLAIPRK